MAPSQAAGARRRVGGQVVVFRASIPAGGAHTFLGRNVQPFRAGSSREVQAGPLFPRRNSSSGHLTPGRQQHHHCVLCALVQQSGCGCSLGPDCIPFDARLWGPSATHFIFIDVRLRVQPRLLVVDASIWATSLLAVVVRCVFCGVFFFFSQLCCPLRFQNP